MFIEPEEDDSGFVVSMVELQNELSFRCEIFLSMRNVRKKECLNESYGDIALIMYKRETPRRTPAMLA